ncbi:MAG TPA: MG2 domain-containing protein [Thermoanaerobaculia bacterium]|nr:MG2 domain-containing protein [Thermoanaerobaculia bacterium]
MASPFATLRDKLPARLRSALSRRWHWKDLTIGGLGLLVVVLAAYAFREPLAAALPGWLKPGPEGEEVKVFDVVLDREGRAFVDVLFDRPLGEGAVGEVLAEEPATIAPALAGTWKWQDTNALRFQPSGQLPIASQYTFTLLPERILKPGQVFTGDTELVVRTDQFLVEGVDVQEEPALEGKARVIYRGTLRFNYAVHPELLVSKIRLVDPDLGEDRPIEVSLETDWPSPQIGFQTAAVQKRRDERKVRLVIDSSLTPFEGNVPLTEDFAHEIPVGSSERLAVWGVETEPGARESTLRIRFSSPISAAVAEKYVRVEPAVRYRPSAERNVLSLTGELRPGEAYKLTIAKGLPATDDAVLREEYAAQVRLPDLEPSVGFQSQGMFLSASGTKTVAIDTVNVDEVQLTIDRVYLNNLFFLFQYGNFFEGETTYAGGGVSHAFGDRVTDTALRVRGQRNQPVRTPLTLDRRVPRGKTGLYRVVVARAGHWEGAQRWLLVTDLGAVAKRGDGELLLWVSSFRDLGAIEGARVTLLSDQNQVIGEGRTDGAGLWRFADAEQLRAHRPYMVTIERGGDFSFLLLDAMQVDTAGLDVGGEAAPGSGYTAYLYGERDIYRPGEKVEGLAIVRDGNLRAPDPMPVLLRHRDPLGRERGTQRLETTPRGHAPFTLDLPPYALTGHHTLEMEVAEKVVGQYRFQVEEFVPDRIEVEIAPPTAPVGPGQALAYHVAGTYLFGPPAAGLPVESRVRLVDADFAPPGYAGFIFRNPERELDEREVLSAEGTLDDAGRAAFEATMPAGAPVPSSLEAVITARVQERGGRGVAALQRLRIHPYPYYVGLRRVAGEGEGAGEAAAGEGFVRPGQAALFEYAAVGPDGKEVPSKPLRADLFLDRWNTVLRRTPAGTYRYESTRDSLLIDSRAIAGGKGRGRFRFQSGRAGSYRVVLTDPDTQAAAAVEFFVSEWGYSPWALKNPARLELDLDRAEYAPGDTATVQVRAPFPGKLLLTVERERVFHTSVHRLDGNTARIEVPVSVAFRPNAYVTATLVRRVADLEPGSPGRAFGAVPIGVDRAANRLAVEIAAPAEVRPETKVTVGVKTAPEAIVTVAAVDEGVLQLIAQETPQPFEHFYRKLALTVASFDTFSLLLPDVAVEGGAPRGGGEGMEGLAQSLRTEGIRRTEPVAFWSGPVETDAEGRASVSFRLPEFQGAVRLMAVAVQGERFGSSDRRVRVRSPLVLLPTFPRVLSFAETLRLPVSVRNDTGRDGAFRVALAVDGPARVEGDAATRVEVAHGREGMVHFDVRTADRSGAVRMTVTAAGNGESSRSREEVPVRPDLPVATAERSGAFQEAAAELPLADPDRFRPETLHRELAIGPVPIVQFSGKLRDLLTYPYGCLEQTVSTAFPLVYLAELAERLDPDLFRKAKPAGYVAEGVRRVSTMQLFDGGFALWPGEQTAHPWGSVYATHFLVEARRAGHPVDDTLHKAALDYLAGQVKAKAAYGSDELQRAAYALYVLARAGRPDVGTMDFLREKHRPALRPESRALLAAAYAAAGNPQALNELIANLAEVERVARQTGGNWSSTVRNRALLLLALLDAAPRSPRIPALVDVLARDAQAATTPWNTQESGFTLLALGQLFKRQAALGPYSGTVFAGDRKVGSFTQQTVAFRDIRGTAPLRVRMNAGYKPGAAFFSLRTRGVPADRAFQPAAAGLEVQREILSREGGPVNLGSVRQGDLVVLKTRVRSVSGPVWNVALVQLLPSGLEVENPRLETTETLPWVTRAGRPRHLDLRDDRILIFTDLPPDSWQEFYALARAVSPGRFRLPPVQAEAMYDPARRATGERGEMEVQVRK